MFQSESDPQQQQQRFDARQAPQQDPNSPPGFPPYPQPYERTQLAYNGLAQTQAQNPPTMNAPGPAAFPGSALYHQQSPPEPFAVYGNPTGVAVAATATLQPSPSHATFYNDDQYAYVPQAGPGPQSALAIGQRPSPGVSPTFPTFSLAGKSSQQNLRNQQQSLQQQQQQQHQLEQHQLEQQQLYAAAPGGFASSGGELQANAAFGDMGYLGHAPVGLAQFASRMAGGAKRMRGLEEGAWDVEGGMEEGEGMWEEGGAQGRGDEHKPKPTGACTRCKGLKVRCEFIGDSDTCKRCTNGGHECSIPGRKKRKPPPKREHLLNQIRDQASQITDLISKLEEANRRASRRLSVGAGKAKQELTAISPSELSEAESGAPLETGSSSADVEDWIKKARQSIEAFGGYINMGGPSVTMDMLGDDGDGESARSEDEYEYEYEYELKVEDEEESGGGGEGEAGHELETDSLFGEEGAEGPRGRGPFSRESTESTPEQQNRPGRGRPAGGPVQRLAVLPDGSVPFGLMANLALTKSRRRGVSGTRSDVSVEDATEVGLANDDYFRPSPAPERPIVDEQQQPAILRNGIIRPDEAEKLFAIYYDYMNLSLSLLDPVLYTAPKTYWRSPFLFTVICAIASRHYAPRPDLYQQAMKYARLAAGTALIGGQKSVEVVQAYILLSLYPVPARRWEEDRSFIYLGLAIRVATDLKLHYASTAKPENELHAREMLNRTRVWLNCFNLDRSTGSQYGQRPIIDNADYVANHTEFWWKSSPYNMAGFDVHTCCYNAELKVMADFRARIYSNPNHPTGLNKEADLATMASETDDKLAHLWETWIVRVREANTEDPQSHFRTGLLKLAFSYARLSVLSVGFQHTFGKATTSSEVPFLWRCLRAATDTVKAVVDEIGIPNQKIYLRHGPEAQSVFVTFASAFLVKLLQPKYAAYLSREKRIEIRDLVQRVIDLLSSPEVAIDDRHGPKLYARFLEGLLATPMARIDQSPSSSRHDALSPRRISSKQPSASSSPSQPYGSFSTRQSLSPPPTSSSANSSPKPLTPPPALPMTMTMDQYGQTVSTMASYSPQQTTSDLDTPGFFSPPLFYDTELLQSMQSITDLPDMVLPGFNWMGSMQNDINPNLRFDQPVFGFSGSV